jgi:very-short-patch-repair endonuclease
VKAEPQTRAHAKAMRRALTYAETILWARLKGRQLGAQFRKQHPIGPYIADFACPQLCIVVEADGETHSTLAERQHDARRAEFIEQQGWTILRFWNGEIRDNTEGVLENIREALWIAGHPA